MWEGRCRAGHVGKAERWGVKCQDMGGISNHHTWKTQWEHCHRPVPSSQGCYGPQRWWMHFGEHSLAQPTAHSAAQAPRRSPTSPEGRIQPPQAESLHAESVLEVLPFPSPHASGCPGDPCTPLCTLALLAATALLPKPLAQMVPRGGWQWGDTLPHTVSTSTALLSPSAPI